MDWIDRIKKGDVLRFRGDVLRVVRDVSHYEKYGRTHTNVTLAIRHCSWTGRPYTVLTDHDLRSRGARPTRAKVSLRKKIDREIERDFNGRVLKRLDGTEWRVPLLPPESTMRCCDVIGKVN